MRVLLTVAIGIPTLVALAVTQIAWEQWKKLRDYNRTLIGLHVEIDELAGQVEEAREHEALWQSIMWAALEEDHR